MFTIWCPVLLNLFTLERPRVLFCNSDLAHGSDSSITQYCSLFKFKWWHLAILGYYWGRLVVSVPTCLLNWHLLSVDSTLSILGQVDTLELQIFKMLNTLGLDPDLRGQTPINPDNRRLMYKSKWQYYFAMRNQRPFDWDIKASMISLLSLSWQLSLGSKSIMKSFPGEYQNQIIIIIIIIILIYVCIKA